MTTVGVHEAKTHLSRLLERVRQGETIVITKSGAPVARLGPIAGEKRVFGRHKGNIWMAKDFDAPLPEEIARLFRGEGD
jgi:prevent-host-death family protein